MPLDTRTIGIAAIVGGGTYIGYTLYEGSKKGASSSEVAITSANFTPGVPTANAPFTMTVTIQNPTTTAQAFGVQAAIVQGNGDIGGHFWASAAIAQAADQAYTTAYNAAGGGAAGTAKGDQAVATMAGLAADRVVYVDIQPGQSQTVTLAADPQLAGTYEVYIFAMASPPAGALIARDANAATIASVQAVGGQAAHLPVTVS